jgi:glycine/D-amino acid oxidase-like deaminating enzyme
MSPPAYSLPGRRAYDVVIVGGAVIGSAVAYWLGQDPAFDGSVLVVERDSSYEFSSTALSASSIRQQFSNPINVKISQFGIEFIRSFADRMAKAYTNEIVPHLGFREHGYLNCWSPGAVEDARARVDLQRSLGAHTVFLDPHEILARFPYLNVQDLGGASLGERDEGWFDSMGLLQGFRRAARFSGVEYVNNEVASIERARDRILAVVLKDGTRIDCAEVVNAAGPRAGMLANMAGLHIPVEPRKRHNFTFTCATPIPGLMPLVVDPDGTFVRPEGELFLCGNTPEPDGPAAVDDFTTAYEDFEARLWPSLAHRIPQFEAIRAGRCWTGHYAYNTLDQNAIVGRHPQVENFLFANGFSGHGLQQSPAVGRAVSELIVYGRYQTLDLTPFGYARIAAGEPFLEKAVI